MKQYKVTLDGMVVEDGLTYREALELAEELDNHPHNYLKTVDVEPMTDKDYI
jgi:hypothetical protein